MSHIPRMTFIGAYGYDPNLFDNLTFPAGISKDLAVNTFLMRFGECPMLYTDLRFQKLAFAVWSDKWSDGIARMLLALESEYNPIHNFDRYEDYSESELTSETTDYTGSETTAYTGSETTSYTGSEVTNYTGSETTDYTGSETFDESSSESSSETAENEVSAYNESTYQSDKRTVTDKEAESGTERTTERDLTDSHKRNLTDSHSRNLSDSHSRNLSDSRTRNLKDSTAGDRAMEHVGHLYGNIGLTTSQQMIIAEIDMRGKYNIYDIIAELLRGEFCLYYY